jgi:DNA gyrase subunit A
MGRSTSGVKGMDVGDKSEVIAMDIARDDMDLLVITDNGYGKRTQVREYRKTKRGAKGVKTITMTEAKGGLAGALVVREHQDLIFISREGMVQRTAASGINRYGRGAQGVKTMNVRDGDVVSAVAMVVEDAEGSAGEAELDGDELEATTEEVGEEAEIVEAELEPEEDVAEEEDEAEAADEEDE